MKLLKIFYSILIIMVFLFGCRGQKETQEQGISKKEMVTETVKFDFHIMSKCPFGVKVVDSALPILQKMGTAIDFRLHYIGREQAGELKSMHGDQEVLGNIIQLCVHNQADYMSWLNFIQCQNEDWRKIPNGWEDCAKSANIDITPIKNCYEGPQGKKLLAKSYEYSSQVNAKGSPTIFLSGRPYTGGRTEASFGRALCGEFKQVKPDFCANIPEPVKIPITVVVDKRCEGRTCNPRRFLSFVRNTFEGAEITTLDYSEPEGRALFERTGQRFLPIAVFGANVEKVETGFNRLKRRLEKMDNGDYVYPFGKHGRPPWNPTAEICDDGIDNTGNGLVDCEDPTCTGNKICRDEIKKRLDLFVMSKCPYGVRTVNAMAHVLDHFNKDRNKLDFYLQFIGENKDGKLTSIHGYREIEENLRQMCVQKYYSNNYKFLDYVLCRNEAFQKNQGKEDDNAWEACARDGINDSLIKKCAESEEGYQLLADSFELASSLDVASSPSWLLNNRYDIRARASVQITRAFCEKNQDVSKCEKQMKSDDVLDGEASVPAGTCGSESN